MAKTPVKRRYNTDTNQWEVVKPRTGPTPASNTRKKMRLAATAAEAEKKKTAPKPAAKKKKTTTSSYSGPYGANASVDSATPKGPKGRGGKRVATAAGGARPEGPAGSMPVPAAPGATGPSVRMRKRKPKVLGIFENYNETLRKEENKRKLAASRKRQAAGGLFLGTHPGAAGYGK